MKRMISGLLLLCAAALLVLAGMKLGPNIGITIDRDTEGSPSDKTDSVVLVDNPTTRRTVLFARDAALGPSGVGADVPNDVNLTGSALVSPFGPMPREPTRTVSHQNNVAMRDSPAIVWPRHSGRP